MTNELKPAQALIVFGLLARYGASAQSKLMPQVKRPDREALISARLCSVEKRGRALHLSLTDAGWAWAADHLTADLPPSQRSLADLLARIQDYLQRSGATIADIIGSGESNVPAISKAKAPGRASSKRAPTTKTTERSAKTKTTRSMPAPTVSIRASIEAAYLELTGGRTNEPVRLSKLREKLSSIDRAALDDGFREILKGDATAHLLRHDDPKQLTQADHDAAFNPFGQPFHKIWISS